MSEVPPAKVFTGPPMAGAALALGAGGFGGVMAESSPLIRASRSFFDLGRAVGKTLRRPSTAPHRPPSSNATPAWCGPSTAKSWCASGRGRQSRPATASSPAEPPGSPRQTRRRRSGRGCRRRAEAVRLRVRRDVERADGPGRGRLRDAQLRLPVPSSGRAAIPVDQWHLENLARSPGRNWART